MNKMRRQELRNLIKELRICNVSGLDNCINDLENIKYDEESYYDNAPENLQYSKRYEASQESIDDMDEAMDCLNNALDCQEDEYRDLINKAIGYIESAVRR